MATTESATTHRAERAAIVVAGGRGHRFGGLKQYRPLGATRVLDHSLAAASTACGFVVLVVPPDLVDEPEDAVDMVVAGGTSRSDSVRAGLAVVPDTIRVIVVHDAVRPLATVGLFDRVVAAVDRGADAAVPGVAVVDTLRLADGGVPAVGRDELVAVQTPQAFSASALRQVHGSPGAEATDDATLISLAGGSVAVVAGERENLKITEEADLAVAEALLARATVDGAGSGPVRVEGAR